MDFFIIAELRNSSGKNNSVKIRENGKVPAVIYFSGVSIPICFDFSYINSLIKNIYSGNRLLTININNDKYLVVVKDFYKHPVNDEILHVDFQKVSLSDFVTLDILLNFVGEKASVGIKQGGFLVKHRYFVKVRCSVSNVPKFIDVDVSKLNVNESMYVSDLIVPDNVKLSLLLGNVKSKSLVASISGSRTLEQKKQDVKVK